MTPSASAASVPILMGRWRSAALALRVRRGSITTIGTPRFFLCSSASAQKCTLVAARSAPHEITRSECTTSSGSAPPTGPTVTSHAVSQQVSHTVPACRREAPSAWNRPFTSPRFIRPWWAE